MSSYLTSPFVLEERRLQGIVNQCCQDLYSALRKVEEQEKRMEDMARQQKEKDKKYHSLKQEAVSCHEEQQIRLSEEAEKKKKALEEQLKTIDTELSILLEKYDGMEAAVERQKGLWLQWNNTYGNFEEIERHIIKQEEEIRKEVREASERKTKVSDQYSRAGGKNGSFVLKGISLQVTEEKPAEYEQESPRKIFEDKLRQALGFSTAGQYFSLTTLKEEFDKEPDYAKTSFAVRHMKRLETILKQLEKLSVMEQRNLDRRREAVRQYKAVCGLMEITPDETLMADEKAGRTLIRQCDILLKEYEEKKKRQYVAGAIASVMERHGIRYQNSEDFHENDRMHFEMEDALLDVSGVGSGHLIMEVSGEYAGETPTLNERRKSAVAAGRFCSVFSEIETELEQEYGILFGHIRTQEPDEETIEMKKRKLSGGNEKYIRKKVTDTYGRE